MVEQDKIDLLKEILFTEEQKSATLIQQELKRLTEIIEQREQLSVKVDPIIEQKLLLFTKEIPEKLGPTITEALKKEIRNSQDAVVEAMYPIIGQLIKKYIAHEINLLSEKVSQKTSEAFSIISSFNKLVAKMKGVTEGERNIAQYAKTKLEQLFVIEKDSGLLKANYSADTEEEINEDMIAGMLTAIKSFVEDAFQTDQQFLEHIAYDSYHIHIQNFSSYYIAVVLSGVYTTSYKDHLEDLLLDFVKEHVKTEDLNNQQQFTEKVKIYFANESI